MKPVVEECDLRVHSVIKSQQELGLQIEHLTCGPPPLPLPPRRPLPATLFLPLPSPTCRRAGAVHLGVRRAEGLVRPICGEAVRRSHPARPGSSLRRAAASPAVPKLTPVASAAGERDTDDGAGSNGSDAAEGGESRAGVTTVHAITAVYAA